MDTDYILDNRSSRLDIGPTTQESRTLGQHGGVRLVPARGQTAVTMAVSLLELTVHGAGARAT